MLVPHITRNLPRQSQKSPLSIGAQTPVPGLVQKIPRHPGSIGQAASTKRALMSFRVEASLTYVVREAERGGVVGRELAAGVAAAASASAAAGPGFFPGSTLTGLGPGAAAGPRFLPGSTLTAVAPALLRAALTSIGSAVVTATAATHCDAALPIGAHRASASGGSGPRRRI